MRTWYALGAVSFPVFPLAVVVALIAWIKANTTACSDLFGEHSISDYFYKRYLDHRP